MESKVWVGEICPNQARWCEGVPEAVASRLKDHEAAAAAAGGGSGSGGGGDW